MILQRMAQAIKRQDWFQVAIEILIVVIGIFLGLQVTDWNDGRAERVQEREYVSRLHQDIEKSITINERSIELAFSHLNGTKIVSESLATCQLADEDKDKFANGLYRMARFLPLTLTGTVIDELKSTGNFQLIQNIEIRSAVIEHIDALARIQRIRDSVFLAVQPQMTIIEKNFNYRLIPLQSIATFESLKWEDITINFEQLCHNEEILNALSHVYADTRGLAGLSMPALDQQRAIKAMLEAEMEKDT